MQNSLNFDMKDLSNVKAVLLDVDNTLLDFDESAKRCMIAGYKDFGLVYQDWMWEDFRRINLSMWEDMEKGLITKEELIHTRWQRVFDYFHIDADGRKFEDVFRKYLNEIAVQIDGALDLVKYLAGKYELCVASNAPYQQQMHRLESAGMMRYIQKIFVSEKIGYPKPRKEFFDACFDGSPLSPNQTVMIGDSLTADIKGAREYGINTIWFNHYKEDATNVDCDYVVNHLCDIKSIL